jgi:FkbM family methyltransferase
MRIASNVIKRMENSKVFSGLAPRLKNNEFFAYIVHYYDGFYGSKRNSDRIETFTKCYKENKEKFKETYNLLTDECSRETYKAIIEFRKSYKYSAIRRYICYPQYFLKDIFNYNNEIFVDGGGFRGDTVRSLVQNVPIKNIKKIYVWEPDETNEKYINEEIDKVQEQSEIQIEMIPCALYNEKTILKFQNYSLGMSHIDEKGTISVHSDTIDNRCPNATFIKMDVEGAEIAALHGAKNTIIKNKPKLAICVYHRNEDLYEIPLLLHEWVPEYNFYIRHHSAEVNETVLYAVKNEN